MEKVLIDTSAYYNALVQTQYEQSLLADSLFELLPPLDSALAKADDEDSIAIEAAKVELWGSLAPVLELSDSLRLISDSLRILKITSAIASNNSISVSTTSEQYHKTVSNFYLRLLASDTSLNEEDMDDVIDIAQECYVQYGTAVLEARAIIAMFDTRSFDVFDDCVQTYYGKWDEWEDTRQQMPDTSVENTVYRLYPNPTSQSVTIEKIGTMFSDEEISIIDAQGKIMAVFSGNGKGNMAQLNIRFLAIGSYHCRISRMGKTLAVLPFKIVR